MSFLLKAMEDNWKFRNLDCALKYYSAENFEADTKTEKKMINITQNDCYIIYHVHGAELITCRHHFDLNV